MSQISPQRAERAIRERFNPIVGLKPAKLSRILDAYHAGYLREAALLWDAMERRDLLIRTVASKRKKAVARAQYEILAIDKSETALLHKAVLEKFYDNLTVTDVLKRNQRGGVGLLRRQMMDAVGKGFAVHEIVWKWVAGNGAQRALGKKVRGRKAPKAETGMVQNDGGDVAQSFLTAEFIFCPLWFFENTTGELRFLEQDGATEGVPMKQGEWLVTCGDAIMEPCSVAYCYKHMALKDWVVYSQGFGSPIPWGKTEEARDSAGWQELETAVSQMMSEMSIVTSNSESIELIESKGGGSNFPMPNLVEYCDRGIAAAWRGADLSTMSQGSSGLGASLQGDEGDLLQEDDANETTEQLWAVDKMVIQMATGDDEPLAYIKILPPKKQAVDQDLQIDEALVGMGCELSQDDALERYGRSPAQENDPILQKAAAPAMGAGGGGPQISQIPQIGNGDKKKLPNEDRVRKAKRALLAPVMARLREIDGMEGADKENALRGFLAELPGLKIRLENEAGEGELADALAEEMQTALLAGLSKKENKR